MICGILDWRTGQYGQGIGTRGAEADGALGRLRAASRADDTAARDHEIDGDAVGCVGIIANPATPEVQTEARGVQQIQLERLAHREVCDAGTKGIESAREDMIRVRRFCFFRRERVGELEHVAAERNLSQIVFDRRWRVIAGWKRPVCSPRLSPI